MFDEDKDKFIETVNKFYPKMREFALRNNIIIKDIAWHSGYRKDNYFQYHGKISY